MKPDVDESDVANVKKRPIKLSEDPTTTKLKWTFGCNNNKDKDFIVLLSCSSNTLLLLRLPLESYCHFIDPINHWAADSGGELLVRARGFVHHVQPQDEVLYCPTLRRNILAQGSLQTWKKFLMMQPNGFPTTITTIR